EYNFDPSIKLKTNVRYEKNSLNYNGTSDGLNQKWEKITLPPIRFNIDHAMFGYRTALHYLKDKFTSFYGSVSQGYKSGGVNQQPFLSDASRPYEPEFIQNFEIGLKRATKKYQTQLSAFYSLRKDQQVSVSSQQDKENPNSFLFYTGNAGSGTIQGFEWENTLNLSSNLNMDASLGYLTTWVNKFTYFAAEGVEAIGGDREAAMSPKMTGSVGFNFKNNSGIFGLVQMSFKDEYYFSDSHNQKSKPYTLLNINIGKSFGKTIVKLWIRNALDERYTTRGFYFGLIPPTYPDQLWKSYGDPRQIGVTIDYTF
ncbi:MAG: TonB-dependent receptor, partial [Candidatus Marinimicrobia bacterium]|nr:TonB-dependent receptor [Candidatus Neomarinimicrobiota bacterium]